jgi:DNA primase
MAEAGSFAERVKTQADIVRVVGEYVRLKKAGQNFVGLCPFHSEKTPSFAVHPVKQIYHCFGCGVGGDAFSFIMAMEKCEFPEAVRRVAEVCGIPVPKRAPRSPQEAQATRLRAALVELYSRAAAFYARQLNETPEGRVARAYLEERGLDAAAIGRFGIGYAPASGDALLSAIRRDAKAADRLLEPSGLFSRSDSGRLFDRFRRRILFPIRDAGGKVVAFGGRALGDDLPKYLNSPETPIYSKSRVLYHFFEAREAMRQSDGVVLVEGYMDAISVARAGVTNVVASCGTSLTEAQAALMKRFTRRCIVNYDPDAAGQAATERSLALLLEQGFEVRVLALPGGADPDQFIRERGAEEYRRLVAQAPEFIAYLIERARRQDLSSGEGKLRAMNFLLPYVQRVPDRLLRSEWATRIAAELRIEEPVLREALRRAAAERRDKVQTRPELLAAGPKPAEKRLLQLLLEVNDLSAEIAARLREGSLHRGLESEKLFESLLEARGAGAVDVSGLAARLEEKDRRLLFELEFAPPFAAAREEAESCLAVLRRRQIEAELSSVQRGIESNPRGEELRALLTRKQELRKRLTELPV